MSSILTILPQLINMSSLTSLTTETQTMNCAATEAIACLAFRMSIRFRQVLTSTVLFVVGIATAVDAKQPLLWSNVLLRMLTMTLNFRANTTKFSIYWARALIMLSIVWPYVRSMIQANFLFWHLNHQTKVTQALIKSLPTTLWRKKKWSYSNRKTKSTKLLSWAYITKGISKSSPYFSTLEKMFQMKTCTSLYE